MRCCVFAAGVLLMMACFISALFTLVVWFCIRSSLIVCSSVPLGCSSPAARVGRSHQKFLLYRRSFKKMDSFFLPLSPKFPFLLFCGPSWTIWLLHPNINRSPKSSWPGIYTRSSFSNFKWKKVILSPFFYMNLYVWPIHLCCTICLLLDLVCGATWSFVYHLSTHFNLSEKIYYMI